MPEVAGFRVDVNIGRIATESNARDSNARDIKRVLLGLSLLVAGVIAGIALHTAFAEGDTVFACQRPAGLGVTEGRLAPPKSSPNCVSSQADPADAEHYIAPIGFSGGAPEAMAALREIVAANKRANVVRQEPAYLYAEFRSKLLGFVDDVEFFAVEKEGVIHVRSASRLGRRDFGVNRARIEAIRERFANAQASARKA